MSQHYHYRIVRNRVHFNEYFTIQRLRWLFLWENVTQVPVESGIRAATSKLEEIKRDDATPRGVIGYF